LSLKELHTLLKKEAGVALSESQIALLNTFIDPLQQSITIPKFKFDMTRLVDLLEQPLTVSALKAAKLTTSMLLHCIFDIVGDFLRGDLPYAIEEAARSALRVQSVAPTAYSPDLILDETPLLKPDKKK
jgi:hypothetical protein